MSGAVAAALALDVGSGGAAGRRWLPRHPNVEAQERLRPAYGPRPWSNSDLRRCIGRAARAGNPLLG
jgi:hypothetical protein